MRNEVASIHPTTQAYLDYRRAEARLSLRGGNNRGDLWLILFCVVLIWITCLPDFIQFAPPPALDLAAIVCLGFRIYKRRQLARLYRKHFATWIPVTAALVQANEKLFRPGKQPYLPCLVVFQFDIGLLTESNTLRQIAQRMGQLQGTTPANDPDLQMVAWIVHPDNKRTAPYWRTKLPVSFTGGREVYVGNLIVPRHDLPKGYLTDRYLPCIAEPGEQGGIELLPWQFVQEQAQKHRISA